VPTPHRSGRWDMVMFSYPSFTPSSSLLSMLLNRLLVIVDFYFAHPAPKWHPRLAEVASQQ
jgi:hypothetical protein